MGDFICTDKHVKYTYFFDFLIVFKAMAGICVWSFSQRRSFWTFTLDVRSGTRIPQVAYSSYSCLLNALAISTVTDIGWLASGTLPFDLRKYRSINSACSIWERCVRPTGKFSLNHFNFCSSSLSLWLCCFRFFKVRISWCNRFLNCSAFRLLG